MKRAQHKYFTARPQAARISVFTTSTHRLLKRPSHVLRCQSEIGQVVFMSAISIWGISIQPSSRSRTEAVVTIATKIFVDGRDHRRWIASQFAIICMIDLTFWYRTERTVGDFLRLGSRCENVIGHFFQIDGIRGHSPRYSDKTAVGGDGLNRVSPCDDDPGVGINLHKSRQSCEVLGRLQHPMALRPAPLQNLQLLFVELVGWDGTLVFKPLPVAWKVGEVPSSGHREIVPKQVVAFIGVIQIQGMYCV